MTQAADRIILVVEDDRTQLEALKILLNDRSLWRVEGVGSAREALERLQQSPIAAMVTDEEMPEMGGLGLLVHVRNDPVTSHLPVLLLTASTESEIWRKAWKQGADAVLQKPTHPAVLRAALEACILRREEAAVSAEQLRIAERSISGIVELLIRQLDSIQPGMARRGESLATLAETMGRFFEIEPEHIGALRKAARLYTMGNIITGMQATSLPRSWAGLQGRDTAASAALLRKIPALETVAMLIEGMGANWDGSGFPAGAQRGQIPMRSRILRVAVDLQSVIQQSGDASSLPLEQAIAALEMHSGTWYDPAVVAMLHRLAESAEGPIWDPDVDLFSVDDLRVGMQLASDLNTASGIKLLSGGSILTAPNLDLVRRRHDRDPIPNGVAIRHRKGTPDGAGLSDVS